jgi:glutamine synthetase
MEGSSCRSPLCVTFQGLDYRPCSWGANLYLALAGILTSGLDGMARGAALRPPASASAAAASTAPASSDDGSRRSSPASDGAPSSSSAAAAAAAAVPPSLAGCFRALELDELLTSSLPPALVERYTAIQCGARGGGGGRDEEPIATGV